MRQATKDLAAVTSFRARNGRLPETLAEAGIEDSASPDVFYWKER
jgi:hypothetical protein